MLDSFATLAEVIPSPSSRTWKVFHDYTDFLRKHPKTKTEIVDPRYSWPEIHNFYAYCRLMKYDASIVFPMMLLNGLEDPMDFTPNITELIVPDVTVVNDILSTVIED